MNKKSVINYIPKNKECLLLIKKKSEIGFWDYQMFGVFSFLIKKEKDYLIITKKKITYIIKNKLIKDIEYKDFSKIKFNPLNDTISFKNIENKTQSINLKILRLTYEEIQKVKKVLN